jgi:hypothetical protein
MASTNKKECKSLYKVPQINYRGDAVGGTGATGGDIGRNR